MKSHQNYELSARDVLTFEYCEIEFVCSLREKSNLKNEKLICALLKQNEKLLCSFLDEVKRIVTCTIRENMEMRKGKEVFFK